MYWIKTTCGLCWTDDRGGTLFVTLAEAAKVANRYAEALARTGYVIEACTLDPDLQQMSELYHERPETNWAARVELTHFGSFVFERECNSWGDAYRCALNLLDEQPKNQWNHADVLEAVLRSYRCPPKPNPTQTP